MSDAWLGAGLLLMGAWGTLSLRRAAVPRPGARAPSRLVNGVTLAASVLATLTGGALLVHAT